MVYVKRKRKRKRTRKRLKIIVLSVTDLGTVGKRIATLRVKHKKSKWLKIGLPLKLFNTKKEFSKTELRLYIKCKGCDNRLSLELAKKRKRRWRTSRRRRLNPRALNQKRPWIAMRYSLKHSRSWEMKNEWYWWMRCTDICLSKCFVVSTFRYLNSSNNNNAKINWAARLLTTWWLGQP